MGLMAFGAVGDLGLSIFWSLGQTGLRIGTKGLFEALGHMAYTVYGIQHIWSSMHIYHAIALLFHTMPYGTIPYQYYSINGEFWSLPVFPLE